MLFVKRAITAAIFFVVLAVVLGVGMLIVLGGVAGARAATEQQVTGQAAFEVGRQAGAEVRRQYGLDILVGAAGVSAVVACALSFGGAFPWCRPAQLPPPLPPPG